MAKRQELLKKASTKTFNLNNVIENVVRRHELTNTSRANDRVENK